MSDTYQIVDGYSPKLKTRLRRMLTVRPITLDELKRLADWSPGFTFKIICNDGTARDCRVTSVKTWKTRPDDVRIGVKYGLYEYVSFDTAEALQRFVVVVPETEQVAVR